MTILILPLAQSGEVESGVQTPTFQALEAQILQGRGTEALEGLDRIEISKTSSQSDLARSWRIKMLVLRQTGDLAGARLYAQKLAGVSAWQDYAQVYESELTRKRAGQSVWEILFALSLAVFLLGGGRELLRPHPESVVVFLCVMVLYLTTGFISDVYARVWGVLGLLSWVLLHGAVATMTRTRPEPRGRLLLGVVCLAGLTGAVMATLVKIPAS